MFHVIFLVKKADRLSREEFGDYWINRHTPLTASVPGVRSYKCYVTTGAESGEPAYDGVAVLSFDDEAVYQRALAGPEFTAALADAKHFQNVAQTTSLFADEHVIV